MTNRNTINETKADPRGQLRKLTNEEITAIGEERESFYKLYSDTVREYGDSAINLLLRLIDFGYKIAQISGVIAGFGFVAISQVKNVWLFLLGESLLIFVIIYGIFKVKNIYENNLDNVNKSMTKATAAFENKSKIHIEMYQELADNYTPDGKTSLHGAYFGTKIIEANDKLLKTFDTKKIDPKKDNFLTNMLIILPVGATLLILSFFISWGMVLNLTHLFLQSLKR